MHNPLVTTQEMVNQIRAFEVNVHAAILRVDPPAERTKNPDLNPWVFQFEQPHYRLTADDRSQVSEQSRLAMETMERTLMQYVFDHSYCSLPYHLLALEREGYPVYFDYSQGLLLIWLQLAEGIFYMDVAGYISVNPINAPTPT